MAVTSYSDRISFHADDQVMEADFSDMTFEVSGAVNAFYDEMDRKIAETGKKWFFLVNYENTRIMTEAWITFAHRGKKSNIAYSLGSTRYGVDEATRKAILERSRLEQFDPNLHQTREQALTHLRNLRAKIPASAWAESIRIPAAEPQRSARDRISFHPDLGIMEVDFSSITFERSRDVNDFYDVVERELANTGRKWYFLVNYMDCTILPDAWIAFASRGKKVNVEHSLGSVRFDASRDTGAAIRADADKQKFDPNLFGSREQAVAQILAMSAAAG